VQDIDKPCADPPRAASCDVRVDLPEDAFAMIADALSPSMMTAFANAARAPASDSRTGLGEGKSSFPVSTAVLERVAAAVLDAARTGGATAAETEVSQAVGQSVTVRKGEVETISYNRDKGVGVTVYVGARRGHASTADFSDESIRATVDKALAIARYTAEDPCAGLADADRLARAWPDLDLYHPWDLSVDQAIALGRATEAAALAVDPRISNSEGASASRGESEFVYANTQGFSGGYRSSRHHIDCAVIGEADGAMQRDYWYTAARAPGDLLAPAEVGRIAGERTVRRLGGRQLGTLECPVLFEPPEAADLLGSFVHAVSGGSLYRKSSFLLDSLGRQVFAPHVNIREEPHLLRARGSAPFDNEGVATERRDVVANGMLQGYFLGSYSARKLGLQSTGNAGGAHNLVVPGTEDLPALLRRMGKGLLVTEQLGQGVNPVTGDYSRGAAGFWVEDGQIAYPVEEITIAGNLKQMFMDIIALGNDIDRRGSRHIGSMLISRMTIAGS
jgi:PmbA protein